MKCRNCDCELRPLYQKTYQMVDDDKWGTTLTDTVGELIGYGYEGSNVFCSMHCGYAFGMNAATQLKAGD